MDHRNPFLHPCITVSKTVDYKNFFLLYCLLCPLSHFLVICYTDNYMYQSLTVISKYDLSVLGTTQFTICLSDQIKKALLSGIERFCCDYIYNVVYVRNHVSLQDGYRAGIDVGQEECVQEGFNAAFSQSSNLLFSIAELRGTVRLVLHYFF